MDNWIKQHLDYEIEQLKADLKLIALKQKQEEWKRDHYRYTFTVFSQRVFRLLSSTITNDPVSPISDSTKKELTALKDLIDSMLKDTPLP